MSALRRVEDITQSEPTPEPTGKRTWWIVAAIGAVAIGALWLFTGNGDDEPVATAGRSLADVVVTDLVATESYDGTLGRAAGDPVTARAAGTITAAPDEGDTIDQGQALFQLDGEPVVLLFGDLPAYRTLAPEPETTTITSRLAGTITATAPEDAVLATGDTLFVVDDRPVVLLAGATPAYRTLRQDIDEGPDVEQLEAALVALGYDPDGLITVDGDFTANTENMVEAWQEDTGAEVDGRVDLGEVVFLDADVTVESVLAEAGSTIGPGQGVLAVAVGEGELSGDDVAQLEAALAALGYDPGPVDGTYDAATVAAVVAWQEAVGADPDGIVDLGEVVFRPAPVRVTAVLAAPGSAVSPGTPVLATSSADTSVAVALPAEDQGVLAEGDAVTVVLPDNTQVPATVTEVGTVATQGQGGEATFEVTVVLDDPSAAAGLDEAPVEVEVVTDSRRGVLAVPVTALVALAEGGYAVEVEQPDGSVQLVPVTPGFYSSGLVEITSGPLAAGDRVVVP